MDFFKLAAVISPHSLYEVSAQAPHSEMIRWNSSVNIMLLTSRTYSELTTDASDWNVNTQPSFFPKLVLLFLCTSIFHSFCFSVCRLLDYSNKGKKTHVIKTQTWCPMHTAQLNQMFYQHQVSNYSLKFYRHFIEPDRFSIPKTLHTKMLPNKNESSQFIGILSTHSIDQTSKRSLSN